MQPEMKLAGTSPMQHPTHSTQSALPHQQPVHPPSRATGSSEPQHYDWHSPVMTGTVCAILHKTPSLHLESQEHHVQWIKVPVVKVTETWGRGLQVS
jgi:hypothetical protein